jgi:hypothetical protein
MGFEIILGSGSESPPPPKSAAGLGRASSDRSVLLSALALIETEINQWGSGELHAAARSRINIRDVIRNARIHVGAS